MLLKETQIRKIVKNLLLEANFEAAFAGKLSYFITTLFLVLEMKADLYKKTAQTRNVLTIPLQGTLTIDFTRSRGNQTDSIVRECLAAIKAPGLFQGMSGVNVLEIKSRLDYLRKTFDNISEIIAEGHSTTQRSGSPGNRRDSMLRSFSGEIKLNYNLTNINSNFLRGGGYESSFLADRGPIFLELSAPSNLGTSSKVNGRIFQDLFKEIKYVLSHELVHSSQFETSIKRGTTGASAGLQAAVMQGLHPIVHLVNTNLQFSPVGIGTADKKSQNKYFIELANAAGALSPLITNHFINQGRINPYDTQLVQKAVKETSDIKSGNYSGSRKIQRYFNMFKRLHDHFSPQEATAYVRGWRVEALSQIPNQRGQRRENNARKIFESIIKDYFQNIFYSPNSPLKDLNRELGLVSQNQYKNEAIEDYMNLYDTIYQPVPDKAISDPLRIYIKSSQIIKSQTGFDDFLLDTLNGQTPGITNPRTYVKSMLSNMGLTDVPD